MAIATPLSTSGRFIVDANGKRIRLAGVNWYGASEDMGVAAGLDRIDRGTLAGLIAAQGFNSVRLPFSVWMTEQTAPVPQRFLAANPDLDGKTPLEVYDACVKALTDHGLIVIPNCHLLDFGWCCTNDDSNGLWFNDRFPAQKFTAAWQTIAKRYASDPLVAAMDIKNEPRPAKVGGHVITPAWGTGGQADFAAMYTSVGNMIHQFDPHALIICEGLNYAQDLTGAASHPVRLTEPNKVVYSMHDYHWFHNDPHQTQAAFIAGVTHMGGYLLANKIAPVWIGEFGRIAAAPQPGTQGPEPWWGNIQAWLAEADIDWCWWALNPTHGQSSSPGTSQIVHALNAAEPFGLLTPDWSGVGFPAIVASL
ncbi:MAG TPA: glycoside hydrolase family 5 protein, partial [Streptosporangiaceae bacterium]|nr:glycoside hydrolase family 5 protein [Streptosporangiaceae bacterium]